MLFACFQGNLNNMKDLDSSSKDSVEKHVHVFKWHYIGRERGKDVICLG